MPELPEVLTIANTLNQNISGFKIKNVEIRRGFTVRPSKEAFVETLKGNQIINVSNIAKNIVFELAENSYLMVHLAMTGQLVFKKLGEKPSKWERAVFTLVKDKKALNLVYNDMRMFGKLEVINEKDFQNIKKKYGLNPLNKKVTAKDFYNSLLSKKTNIKNALLDQKVIAGAGNIYVNDALFMAGINPKRKTNQISLTESEKLLEELRKILEEGIKHRGSTLSDGMFIDPFGKKGKHQEYFRIYGKKICPKCKEKVVFEKINGRGTYFCKVCQK